MNSRELFWRRGLGMGLLLGILLLMGSARANVPLQVRDSSAVPGSDKAAKSKEARQAAPQTVRTGEEALGPVEDIPSTATLFLLDPARPEQIEAVNVGEGLKLTARVRIGDAEVYVIEPEGELPFELPILSLTEAKQNGLVEIREITPEEAQTFRGEYPSGGGGMVVARNKGEVYVLFVGGEVLDGGHQDRLVASSAILPPKSGWIPLPVNCIEKGRGQGPSGSFDVADAVAHPVLRAHSMCRADQQAVWGEVDRVHKVERSANPTHTYLTALTNGRDRAAIRKAADGIGDILNNYPKAVGLVFVRDGAVQSVERMASPSLFKAQSKSILASHLMGLVTRKPVGVASGKPAATASADELKGFFGNLQNADRLRAPLNHQGVGVVVRGPGILGGETLTNLAPKDPALKTFAADLSRKGPAPNVLNQWAVRLN